jgi:hypothetical protein
MNQTVLQYLESKGLNLKRADDKNVHCACFFCGEDDAKRGRLYINIDENENPKAQFFCHLCGESGAINKIRKHFGDPILKDDDAPVDYKPKSRLLDDACEYYFTCLGDNEEAYKYLRYERGLEIETIEKFRLGYAGGGLVKHMRDLGYSLADLGKSGLIDKSGKEFFYNHITIPYMVAGRVAQIRGRSLEGEGSKYMTPSGNKAMLFNSDTTWGADKVIVTEGEFDAIVLEQLGYNAVGVAGANSWKDEWTGYLTDAKQVFICFDNDKAGFTGSEKVALSVGSKARVMTMPEVGDDGKKNDITEWIIQKGNTKDDFEVLLRASVGGNLITVDEAFLEWEGIQGIDGLKTGFPQIDRAILPGILPGQVVVVLAKTGVGKTICTLNAFYRMAITDPSLKILFVSLEQTRSEWFERARRIYRFYNLQATDADALNFWRDRLFIVDKNRLTEDELVGSIDQFQMQTGERPGLVAVDYLGYWARSFRGEAYERTSAAVMSLKAVGKDQRIPIWTPHQVSRGADFGEEPDAGASRDSGVVEETADLLMALWSPDNRKGKEKHERNGEVNMKILKSRHGGVGTIQKIQFAPVSLAMIPGGDPLWGRAQDELASALHSETFEQVIQRHKTGNRAIDGF